jgi:hypothetical protein
MNEAADWNLTLAADNITPARPTTCGGVSNFSKVTIAYRFETVLPLLITALQNGIDLSVSVCYPNTR